ncbi:MAG: glycosyltransferase family 2 protein [Myxococcales bacterium]|nr:glycosyltransferase family 2 protein [Myxococcales bacterium]
MVPLSRLRERVGVRVHPPRRRQRKRKRKRQRQRGWIVGEVCVVIPVFQAAGKVGDVVRGALASGLPVIAVDDGSSDGSGDEAAAAGATVLRHPKNHGKGAALQTGFAFAERKGAEAVLTLDADGQHDPAEIAALVAAHRASPRGLVIGVRRFDDGVMPRRSQVGNRISTWWISRFAGRPHADTQSGFRVYPRALYAGARFRTSRFDTETELILRAAKLGLPLVEVPIKTIYAALDGGRHTTHFRNVRDTLRIIRLVIGSPLWRIPPGQGA